MSFAGLNATEFHRLKGTIVKIDVIEYHFSESANIFIMIIWLKKILSIWFILCIKSKILQSLLAIEERGVFILAIFPGASERQVVVLHFVKVFRVCLVFHRSQKFQIFRTPYHKTIKTKRNRNKVFSRNFSSRLWSVNQNETYLNEAADQIINRIRVTRKWGVANNSRKEFQNYVRERMQFRFMTLKVFRLCIRCHIFKKYLENIYHFDWIYYICQNAGVITWRWRR